MENSDKEVSRIEVPDLTNWKKKLTKKEINHLRSNNIFTKEALARQYRFVKENPSVMCFKCKMIMKKLEGAA